MVAAFAMFAASAFGQKPRPNIILIYADDLGYGDIGPFGQRYIKTPNLDKMAASGVRFTNFYASAPVCAPSRASLMTGMHQGHAVIRGNNSDKGERVPLRPEDVTIAEVLKTAGYRTGVVGKWGLGEAGTTGMPTKKGFDYFFGYLNQTHAHDYYTDFLYRDETRITLEKGAYTPDLFEKEALAFIEREKDRQFFLYFATILPHANNELTRKTGNGMQVPSDEPYTSEPWSPQQKNYAAMVTRLDATVGKIFAKLEELRILNDTIVVFTSDNGPQSKVEGGYDQSLFQSNGGLRGIKRDLYEGGIREPMIVFWKNRAKPNQTVDKPWTQYDLLATFADAASARQPKTDGVSMLPLITGKEAPRRGFFYWEFYEGGFVQAARFGDWKAIRRGQDGAVELYDLTKDPREERDVSKANPRMVARAVEIMTREHVESPNWRVISGKLPR